MKRLAGMALVFGVGVICGSGRALTLARAQDGDGSKTRAQDGDDSKKTITRAEQAKREETFGRANGSGIALACYASQQHLGDMAQSLVDKKLALAAASIRAGALGKALKGHRANLESVNKILSPAEVKQIKPLFDLVSESAALAAALEAYTSKPTPEAAKAFIDKQAKAWKHLCEAIGVTGPPVELLRPRGGKLGQAAATESH